MLTENFSVNEKLFENIEKEIALFMFNVGIIKKTELSSFEEKTVFQRLFKEHLEDFSLLQLKNSSEDVYLRVLGMHAFGAGAYSAAKETEFGHDADKFTENEIESIFEDFDVKDAYELALEKMSIPIESGNRSMLDRVIVIGIKEAKLISGNKIFEKENLAAFMKVLFNAGITVFKAIKNE